MWLLRMLCSLIALLGEQSVLQAVQRPLRVVRDIVLSSARRGIRWEVLMCANNKLQLSEAFNGSMMRSTVDEVTPRLRHLAGTMTSA